MYERLHERLRLFVDAGVLAAIPTHFQLWQGEIEMMPYVLSSDATVEEGYVGAKYGEPWMRQPLIFSQVGRDHFRLGCALDAKLESVCTHLLLTYHRGMPVFDLQVIQTHPHGLDVLETRVRETLAPSSKAAARTRRVASLILAAPDAYLARFLGADGWIARARRFDYPSPSTEGSAFPSEFYSLVGFLDYCARTFPSSAGAMPWYRYPGHFARLFTRRLREGKSFGFWNDASAVASAKRVRERARRNARHGHVHVQD